MMFVVTLNGRIIADGFKTRDEGLVWIDNNLDGDAWSDAQVDRYSQLHLDPA
jgi:isocitrate dehydrogenase